MAEEVSFYSDQSGVRVTDKRVILGNTTYSLVNITSVSTAVVKPGLTGPVLFIVIGLLVLVGGLGEKGSAGMVVFGAFIAALGIVWYRGCKPVWHLRIAERVRAGLRNARAKGKRLGRPRVALDATRIACFRSQGLSWARIAKALDCGVGTAYRASAKCPKTRDSLAVTCHASGQGIAALTR